jgi:hypothetical protein
MPQALHRDEGPQIPQIPQTPHCDQKETPLHEQHTDSFVVDVVRGKRKRRRIVRIAVSHEMDATLCTTMPLKTTLNFLALPLPH